MKNIIIIAVLVVLVAAIGIYLYRAKKRGGRCVGCPCAPNCTGTCGEE